MSLVGHFFLYSLFLSSFLSDFFLLSLSFSFSFSLSLSLSPTFSLSHFASLLGLGYMVASHVTGSKMFSNYFLKTILLMIGLRF
uniref:Uncharacterized protein n=1 Tax=Anguilla anguilla TaxID=7936 RepID=A0A0E9RZI4_ANGAN